MTYRILYDQDSDVLTVIYSDRGKLSHTREMGDFIVHVDKNDEPLFLEILKASKIIPMLVEGLAKKELTVA